MEITVVHHAAAVLLALWIFSSKLGWNHPVLFIAAMLYLYAVNTCYTKRLRRRLQFEERKNVSQRKLLSDSETVRWLNHAVEKIWPICMEQVASQQFLFPIIPWFLDKYKPWPARKAVVQHLYLGRSPPVFTGIRVLGESADDDHLVLEVGINFLSADDMSSVMSVQLLGIGIWTKLHITGMHLEGKVLVGVKFLRCWPFIGRIRVCFAESPYFQMTAKPIFNHGVDVTELPGIAGWLDKILATAFEQTLVEPNMLVIDVEKFVLTPSEGWFSVDEKRAVAFAKVEILEAANMKPSDMNGLADPYVKGQLGSHRFQTKIQWKTLTPKWFEEFKVPITSWDVPNMLSIEVRDKDHIFDDSLGSCVINVSDLRGGQRHDHWINLQNIRMGRLHMAITISEAENEKAREPTDGGPEEQCKIVQTPTSTSIAEDSDVSGSIINDHKWADEFEPISITGQEKTGVWVHRPGSDVSQVWKTRKGRERRPSTQIASYTSDSLKSSEYENVGEAKSRLRFKVKRGLHKIGDILSPKNKTTVVLEKEFPPSPRSNLRAVGEKVVAVQLIVDDECIKDQSTDEKRHLIQNDESHLSNRERAKDMAKNAMKQAGKSAQSLKSVLSKKSSSKSNGTPKSVEVEGYDGSDSPGFDGQKEDGTTSSIGVNKKSDDSKY